MTDYNTNGYNYYSNIITVGETDYLIQGKIDDPLTMFRTVDELLECERDNVQKILQGENL